MMFRNDGESHAHSLGVLNSFYEFDDFMESVGSVLDLGCGSGLDINWWATRTTRDDRRAPLNIKCTGLDRNMTMPQGKRPHNIVYQLQDFEEPIQTSKKFDLLWCHDAFQYVLNPYQTLCQWREVTNDNGMLVLILPQTTNLEFNIQAYDLPDGHHYHWTLVSLMRMLAMAGWDCAGGFFRKNVDDPWIYAAVYRSNHEPLDPKQTSWYRLAELNLLPESAAKSIDAHGYLRQRDLVLPWLDRSMMWYGRH